MPAPLEQHSLADMRTCELKIHFCGTFSLRDRVRWAPQTKNLNLNRKRAAGGRKNGARQKQKTQGNKMCRKACYSVHLWLTTHLLMHFHYGCVSVCGVWLGWFSMHLTMRTIVVIFQVKRIVGQYFKFFSLVLDCGRATLKSAHTRARATTKPSPSSSS